MKAPEILNEGQKKAFEQIVKFIDDSKANYLGLTSGPGCGKTFVLGSLYKQLPKELQKHVHFTATTNKAAQELQKAINEHTGVNLEFVEEDSPVDASEHTKVTTIYKKLGLILVGRNKQLARKMGFDERLEKKDILIIDESSFIDEDLLRFILNDTLGKCKVIFVGDKNQLCPVGLDYTPVFDQTFLIMSGMTESFPIIELHQVMRQVRPDSHIIKYTQEVKDFIEGRVDSIPFLEPSDEITHVPQKEFERLILEAYNNTGTFKVLAQTNAKVAKYNGLVNKHVRDDKYLREGDMATVNTRTSEYFTDEAVIVLESKETVQDVQVEVIKRKQVVFFKEWLALKGRILRVTNGMEVAQYFVPYAQGKTREIVEADIDLTSGVADLRAIHACTVHKSQGSTFDTVFLDLGSFSSNVEPADLARLIYVAISRAKEQVYITGYHKNIYMG